MNFGKFDIFCIKYTLICHRRCFINLPDLLQISPVIDQKLCYQGIIAVFTNPYELNRVTMLYKNRIFRFNVGHYRKDPLKSKESQTGVLLEDNMAARHRISDRNVLVIGTWNFDIVWNLSIVIWDLNGASGNSNRFYLNQLELTLIFR